MGWLSNMVGNIGLDQVIDSVGKNIDRFVTTDKEKLELKRAVENDIRKFEVELLKDRQSAREMYKDDSVLQKIFAIVFLIAYIAITGIMVYVFYLIAQGDTNLPEWGIGFINMIFGAMSAKVNTITDFLFGSSSNDKQKTKQGIKNQDNGQVQQKNSGEHSR